MGDVGRGGIFDGEFVRNKDGIDGEISGYKSFEFFSAEKLLSWCIVIKIED